MLLISSNDRVIRKVCANAAAACGYDVSVAENHEDAIARAGELPVSGSLILVDVDMKAGDGSPTWEQLVRLRPELNFLFIAGEAGAPSGGNLLRIPADRLVPRDFTVDALLEHLARVYNPEKEYAGTVGSSGAVEHLEQILSKVPSVIGRLALLASRWSPGSRRYLDISMMGYPASLVHHAYEHLHATTFVQWLGLDVQHQIFDYRVFLKAPSGPRPAAFPESLVPARALTAQRAHFLTEIAIVTRICEAPPETTPRRPRKTPGA